MKRSDTSSPHVVERASSGIVGLDDVLGGGFPVGQMYLVEGNPGAGKTTLGLQFLIAGAEAGDRCAYVVLAESERALRRLARSHGWSLNNIDVIESNDQDPTTDYSIFYPAEVEFGEARDSLFARLDALKPKRVVMDSLSEVRLLAQDSLRYRRQLMGLRQYFDERNITVLLLDFTSLREDHQLESLCHGIVKLDQLAPNYGGQRRRLRIAKLRESDFRAGYHDFDIRLGGLAVFPRLVASEHGTTSNAVLNTVSTGLPEMDAMLGGLDRGTSLLILGPAGVGKSTMAAQLAKATVERDERVAFFVFDEVQNTIVLRGEGMGMKVRENLASGALTIHQLDPAQVSPGEFAHMVRRAVEEEGAKMVVIDSINGYHAAMPEELYLSAHLHELLAYLNQRGILTILIMTQAGVISSTMTTPIDLSYLADSVILLRYFEAHGEMRQAISVVKRRTGPHERTIRELRIDNQGIRVGRSITDFHGIMTGHLVFTGGKGGLMEGNVFDPSSPQRAE